MYGPNRGLEADVQLARSLPQTAWYLLIPSNDLTVLPLKFVTDVLIPSTQAKLVDAHGVRVLEVGMVPVQKAHIPWFHVHQSLVLPQPFVHGLAECGKFGGMRDGVEV